MRFVSALLLALLPSIVLAHGPAEWIQRGAYKNRIGELCCGERDCAELADEDVKVTAAGYRVTLHRPGGDVFEIVPYAEAQPSPDGKFWRCEWGGERKCFFAPPPGS